MCVLWGAGCDCAPATPPGTVLVDWQRGSAVNDRRVTLGDDVGEAEVRTFAGVVRVDGGEVRITVRSEIGEIARASGELAPALLRGPRRVRITVDDAAGHGLSAQCDEALSLEAAAGARGYAPELTATCSLLVSPDGTLTLIRVHPARGVHAREGRFEPMAPNL
jgi:hypothetical protein